MVSEKKKVKLRNIIENPASYMKIVIDDYVETDVNGYYLINVGYIRVSTDKQADEGYGLEVQEESIVRYCKEHHFTNLVIYVDDGYTGTKMVDRPALKGVEMLIEEFNAGRSQLRIDSFIVPRIDRLGRTLLGTLQFIQDYIVCKADSNGSEVNNNKEDITFISVAEESIRIRKGDAQGKFLLTLFASLAEFDRDLIVQKLKRGKEARLRSGKWPGGGNVPYGYKYDREIGTLVIVPEEAEKIREIFTLYIDHKMSPDKIAARLGFAGDKRITDILKRKSLTGCIVYNGVEYQGAHEAIVSLERWREAQEELKDRSVFRGDSHYLLSGLLYCGECGAHLRYQKWNKDGQCKLVCYSTQKSTQKRKAYLVKNANCVFEPQWADEVEIYVLRELFKAEFLETEGGDDDSAYLKDIKDKIGAAESELRGYHKQLAREGAEDDYILQELIDECRARIKKLKKQLMDVEARESRRRKGQRTAEALRSLQSLWPSMTAEKRQAVIRELVEYVKLYNDGSIDIKLKSKNIQIKED